MSTLDQPGGKSRWAVLQESTLALDDQLKGIGAKFDIVDTVTVDDMEGMTLAEVLLNAIVD